MEHQSDGIYALCKPTRILQIGKKVKAPYKHEALLTQIKKIRGKFKENENYGINRIFLKRKQDYNYHGSERTIYRVCKDNNWTIKKRPNALTKAERAAQKSENIMKQDFTANVPGQKCLSGITEVPCLDGKLYAAPVLDCFDGMIIGLGMYDNMKQELCIKAFESHVKDRGIKV